MKIKFLLSFLLLGQLVFGQTEKHIKVPGTKCSIIPPNDFIASTSFSGFQNAETGASIMINELPGPYQTLVDGFTSDALKTRGMRLIGKQTIDFNNSKATLINVSQPANGITYLKQILIFGDAKGTVLVNGIYPESSRNIEQKIKDAILSTIYSASQDDNPLDAATFTIDVKDTDFKLIQYMSGSLIYSTDGKLPTEKPTLIVGKSIAKISVQNQKQYSEERLKKLPGGELYFIKEIKEISVDNLNGYEIVAEGKTKHDKPELVYQVMLFNDKGDYYIILGQAKEEFETYLQTFKKIAWTFKRK
ncbi:MAG: PsbP-related protein [Flavisolibacter sp.]